MNDYLSTGWQLLLRGGSRGWSLSATASTWKLQDSDGRGADYHLNVIVLGLKVLHKWLPTALFHNKILELYCTKQGIPYCMKELSILYPPPPRALASRALNTQLTPSSCRAWCYSISHRTVSCTYVSIKINISLGELAPCVYLKKNQQEAQLPLGKMASAMHFRSSEIYVRWTVWFIRAYGHSE